MTLFKLRNLFLFIILFVFITSCNVSKKYFSMRIRHANPTNITFQPGNYNYDTTYPSPTIKHIIYTTNQVQTTQPIKPQSLDSKKQNHPINTFRPEKYVPHSKIQSTTINHH